MSYLKILRSYAQRSDPGTLPSSVLLTHTAHTLTIFDAYPKSIFHFLVLPRVIPPLTASDLSNLRNLLKCDKEEAKKVLERLSEDAKSVRTMIEEEMMNRYGFKWTIWTGFHAVPSMEHVHLHVISSDLCSPALKNKKHYNSFHPDLGFFIPLEEVLPWFDAEPSFFSSISQLKTSQYEPLLKDPLACWRCNREFKNMPTLKAHLQEEWDAEAKREKARLERKRKRAGPDPSEPEGVDSGEHTKAKKRQTESPL